MSEAKKHRSLEDITKDFNNLAYRAGQVQYQISALKQDLELANKTLRDLNLEAAAANAASKEAADAALAQASAESSKEGSVANV